MPSFDPFQIERLDTLARRNEAADDSLVSEAGVAGGYARRSGSLRQRCDVVEIASFRPRRESAKN